ncbi:hypothetical protein [Butyrivibrio sp. AD3002]|uniref:hypothetical protein n=1 Tax=Butyrivibrio sp. AD3002 TaxID=1280670 RepID=UPI0003B7A4EC|nr:hypothetical protein [Butyrivibrio sp. AD3002]
MKKRLKYDYHELSGRITVSAYNSRPMTDEEKENYNQALNLLLGDDFEVSLVHESTRQKLASFAIKKGIVSIEIDEEKSEDY